MLRTHARLFDLPADAAEAFRDLGVAGFTPDEVSMIGASGDLAGGEVGTVQGLRLGDTMGSLRGSSLTGALARLGVAESEVHGLAQAVHAGGAIIVIRTDESRSERASTILGNHRPVHSEQDALATTGPEGEGHGPISAPAPGAPQVG